MAGTGPENVVRVTVDEDSGLVRIGTDEPGGGDEPCGGGRPGGGDQQGGGGRPSGGGRPGGPAFDRAVLDIAGGVLSWSVTGPAGLPVAEIHEARRAQDWLWAVYGEAVAGAVDAVRAGAVAAETVTVGGPGWGNALAAGAARLAFGHWAARWWPTSHLDGIAALEPGLLGLESAALTHECQQLFGDAGELVEEHWVLGEHRVSGYQPEADAGELVEEHRGALAPLVRWWRGEPEQTYAGRRLEEVLSLLDEVADGVRREGEVRTPGAVVDVGSLFARPRAYALAADGPRLAGGRLIARGAGTNDWRRYPPGFVDAAENAVSWTASAVGAGRRVEVDVVADVAAPVGGVRLAAEVAVNGGEPRRMLLARRDDVWTGRVDVDLPDALPPRIEVGILLPGFDPGPAHALDPSDRADRDAVRALARRRLERAAGGEPFGLQGAAGGEPFGRLGPKSGALKGRSGPGAGETHDRSGAAGGEPFGLSGGGAGPAWPFLAEIAAVAVAAAEEEDF